MARAMLPAPIRPILLKAEAGRLSETLFLLAGEGRGDGCCCCCGVIMLAAPATLAALLAGGV